MYKYIPSSWGGGWVQSGIKYIDIKSPERSTQKITINRYLLVNAKNNLGSEEHEERMIIKNMSKTVSSCSKCWRWKSTLC